MTVLTDTSETAIESGPRHAWAWALLVYVVAALALGYPALAGGFLVSSQSDQYLAGYERQSEEATRNAMHALAADTGGFLVDNSNDLKAGLKQMLEDTETYYVLAYEPSNPRRDGGFRRVEVRLPGVRDVKVRTRSGYFALDDGRREAADATAEAEARRAEQRRAEMRTALHSLAPLSAIPVRLSADFVSLDPGVSQVVVTGSVDVATLLRPAERPAPGRDRDGGAIGKDRCSRGDYQLCGYYRPAFSNAKNRHGAYV